MNLTEIAIAVAVVLAKGLVVATVLSAIGWLLLRRRSALTSSFFWRFAICGIAFIPLAPLGFRGIEMPGLSSPPSDIAPTEPIAEHLPVDDPAAVQSPAVQQNNSGVMTFTQAGAESTPASVPVVAMLVGVWGIGFVVVIGAWGCALCRLMIWTRAAQAFRPPEAEEMLSRFGSGSTRVRIMISDRVATPIVWGCRRPILFVPPDAENWSVADWSPVLLHELCHIRRQDFLFLGLARFAVAVHWINPFAWRMFRSVQMADERVADDAVLSTGIAPDAYARILANFARRISTPLRMPTPAMAKPSSVGRRVECILDGDQTRECPSLIVRTTLAAIVSVVLLSAGGLHIGSAPAAAQGSNKNSAEAKEGNALTPKQITEEKLELSLRGVQFRFGDHFAHRDHAFQAGETGMRIDGAPLKNVLEFLLAEARERDPSNDVKIIFDEEFGEREVQLILTGDFSLREAINTAIGAPKLSCKVNQEGSVVLEELSPRAEALRKAGRMIEFRKMAQILSHEERAILHKLETLVVPVVDLKGATIDTAIEFCRQQSRELDTTEPDPERKGVVIDTGRLEGGPRFDLNFKDVTLKDLLLKIAELTDCETGLWRTKVNIVGDWRWYRRLSLEREARSKRAKGQAADDPFGS